MTAETIHRWWAAVLAVALVFVPMVFDWQGEPGALWALSIDDGIGNEAVLAVAADSRSGEVRSQRIAELPSTVAPSISTVLVEVHLSRPPPRFK